MLRYLLGAALLMAPSAFAQESDFLDRVQGRWTTYQFKNQAGFAKIDYGFEGREFEEKIAFQVFMPLFPGEGLNFRMRSRVDMVERATDRSHERGTVYDLAMTLVTFEMKFNSVREVRKHNRIAYCGYTDWVAGEYKDVTGLTCDEDPDKPDEGEQTYPHRGALIEHSMVLAQQRLFGTLGLESRSFESGGGGRDTREDDEGGSDEPIPVDWDHPLFAQ